MTYWDFMSKIRIIYKNTYNISLNIVPFLLACVKINDRKENNFHPEKTTLIPK